MLKLYAELRNFGREVAVVIVDEIEVAGRREQRTMLLAPALDSGNLTMSLTPLQARQFLDALNYVVVVPAQPSGK